MVLEFKSKYHTFLTVQLKLSQMDLQWCVQSFKHMGAQCGRRKWVLGWWVWRHCVHSWFTTCSTLLLCMCVYTRTYTTTMKRVQGEAEGAQEPSSGSSSLNILCKTRCTSTCRWLHNHRWRKVLRFGTAESRTEQMMSIKRIHWVTFQLHFLLGAQYGLRFLEQLSCLILNFDTAIAPPPMIIGYRGYGKHT
jgi:hypothetical protein